MLKETLKRTVGPVLSHWRPGNVAMFHIGRCGSTVVGNLLAQHRQIFWDGELYHNHIFAGWRQENGGAEVAGQLRDDPARLLKERMTLALHRYYGLEMKPFHFRLLNRPVADFIPDLAAIGFTHFILLDRRNRLHKIISSLIAHNDRQQYHVQSGQPTRLKQVRVNVDQVAIDWEVKPLLDFLVDYDRDIQQLERLLTGRRQLSLSYEEDVRADPQQAYRKICQFLGLTPQKVRVQYGPTNPFPLAEMIINYDEVVGALAGTPYAWMLQE